MARPKATPLALYTCPVCGHSERQLPDIRVFHPCRGETGLNPPKTKELQWTKTETR